MMKMIKYLKTANTKKKHKKFEVSSWSTSDGDFYDQFCTAVHRSGISKSKFTEMAVRKAIEDLNK